MFLNHHGLLQLGKTLAFKFHEYSIIFKRPIQASHFQSNPSLAIQEYSSSQKLDISGNSKLHFPAGKSISIFPQELF